MKRRRDRQGRRSSACESPIARVSEIRYAARGVEVPSPAGQNVLAVEEEKDDKRDGQPVGVRRYYQRECQYTL
jgi:hypothetical protein